MSDIQGRHIHIERRLGQDGKADSVYEVMKVNRDVGDVDRVRVLCM